MTDVVTRLMALADEYANAVEKRHVQAENSARQTLEAELRSVLEQLAPQPVAVKAMGYGGITSINNCLMSDGSIKAVRLHGATAPQAQQPGEKLHRPVGDSKFESWYATYDPHGKGDKQRARDAYSAALLDCVFEAPQPQLLTDEEMRDVLRNWPHRAVTQLRTRWLYAKNFARTIEQVVLKKNRIIK